MKKILIIDEEETINSVKTILKDVDGDEYNVTGTSFENKALSILKKGLPFNLILLDHKNPHISTKFYHTLLKETSIPIVLISSLEHPEDILTFLKGGCAGFIKKPLNPERFANRLKEILYEIEEKKSRV